MSGRNPLRKSTLVSKDEALGPKRTLLVQLIGKPKPGRACPQRHCFGASLGAWVGRGKAQSLPQAGPKGGCVP